MDLEQLNDETEATVVTMDSEAVDQMVADVEEAAEHEAVVVSALDTVTGLLDMEATFSTIVVADNESITDNQLAAFRSGVAASMTAAKTTMKATFGIDAEATYVDATTAYAKDVEGIKEFFKKIWAKIKAGLVKANAFFRKMFLKFINMVSFRKGTIEKLQEDVAAASTGNEELKASKFGIVKKLAAPATVNGNLSGTEIKIDAATIEAMFAGSEGTELAAISKGVAESAKMIKEIVKKPTKASLAKLEEAMEKAGSGLKDTDVKELEKADASTMKKFKKATTMTIVRATGSKVYVFGITDKSNVITGTVSIKADKVKTLTGLTSAVVTEGLKKAEKCNEDFKSIVDTAFEAYDDAESIATAFEGVKLPDTATDDEKQGLKATEKMGKNLVSSTPWIAFHTSMGIYKATGYAIGLAKAYLKDVKDDKDDK